MLSCVACLNASICLVVCNSLQDLPHPTSVRAGVVGFKLSAVLMLCLFDGLSESIARFLISVRISVPLLKAAADVVCNPWLLVGKCTVGRTSI